MNVRACLAVWLLCCGPPGWAETEERIVWGKVTGVEPITSLIATPPERFCAGPKPSTQQLTEMLAWDLHANCRERTRIETLGYRVSYSWDGRHYTVDTNDRPGDRIALRMRLR